MYIWHTQNVYVRLVQDLHEPYQPLSSASMSEAWYEAKNRRIGLSGAHRYLAHTAY